MSCSNKKNYGHSYKYNGRIVIIVYILGATHCMGIPYLFEVGIIKKFSFNENDYKVLEIATKLWANFAKYGYELNMNFWEKS